MRLFIFLNLVILGGIIMFPFCLLWVFFFVGLAFGGALRRAFLAEEKALSLKLAFIGRITFVGLWIYVVYF